MQLVAIDLDGTLVDSAPDLADGVNAALAALALPPADEATVRSWIGDGVDVLLERAVAAQGGDPATQLQPALATFSAYYSDHLFDRSRLYDGVPETLAALQARGFTLACVTNKREAFARAVLEQAGILGRFDRVIGGDTLPYKKPDPRMLTDAAASLGARPADAVMVGDSDHDLSAADAAGFRFVWASYGYRRDPGAMDPARFRRIDRFPELLEAL